MQNQDPRIIKLFQIISALRTKEYTFDKLMEIISVDEYTLYRYLDQLRDATFNIGKDENGYYFVTTNEVSPYPELTDEEAALMRLLKEPDPDGPLTNGFSYKLKRHDSLATQLDYAIRKKQKVILYEYMVTREGPFEHLVEPIYFGDHHSCVIALDTRDLRCKQFPLNIIRRLSVTREPFIYEVLHTKDLTDMFGIAGEPHLWVTLELHEHAYLELVEEYPLSIPYLTKEDDAYGFHGPVASFAGIGMFVMAFLHQVDIIQPPEFNGYISNRLMLLGNDVQR